MPALNVDKEGFLRQLHDWDESIAVLLAIQDQIELTEEHWQIIHLVRRYYATYQIAPITRVLVKIVREELGDKTGSSIRLMQLFSSKPAKLVSKIAGLPKPANCD